MNYTFIGGFNQYDGLILPQDHATSGFFANAWRRITRSKSKVPEHNEAQRVAFLEHLSKFKTLLLECSLADAEKMNIYKWVNNTFHIYEQLEKQKTFHGDPSEKRYASEEEEKASNLCQVFLFFPIETNYGLLYFCLN